MTQRYGEKTIYGQALVCITAADSGKGQVQLQFRHLVGYPAGEGITVGSRENRIGRFPGVGIGSLVHGINQVINSFSSILLDDPGLLAIPVTVGNIVADP